MVIAPLFAKYGPWAAVTGASTGIGAAFCHALAAGGLHVVLIARREALLNTLASALTSAHGVQTRVVAADLATLAGVSAAAAACQDLGSDFGLLVNNAGVELHGSFLHDDAQKHRALIDLNVTAPTLLTHAVLPALTARTAAAPAKRAGVLFVSSLARNGLPYMASYSASKSYLSTLSLTLHAELAPQHVDILAVEPGVVETTMSEGDISSMGWPSTTPETCAADALDALLDRRVRVTPGQMGNVEADRAMMEGLAQAGEEMKRKWNPAVFLPSDGAAE